MKKRILLLILLIVCALCSSCRNDSPDQQPEQSYEVRYRLETRTDAAGAPEDMDTYTIISYRTATLDDTATANPHVISDTNPRGYYIFLEEDNPAFVEEDFLVPLRVRHIDAAPANNNLTYLYPYSSWNAIPVQDNSYGQKLQEGVYKTAVIHPAAPVINCGNPAYGSHLVVLLRDFERPIYAPRPDGLFDMRIEQPMQVYDITVDHAGHEEHIENTDHRLYITLGMLRAYFYSTPKVDYNIESVQLLNVGTSGWFNPYSGITYINYGSDERVFTTTEDSQVFVDPVEWRISDMKSGGTDTGLPFIAEDDDGNISVVGTEGEPGNANHPVHYLMDNEPVYAADYSGQSGGAVKSLVMRITVNMPIPNKSSDQKITADIPISFKVERGKLYNLYFDIRSGIFSVNYSIDDWNNDYDDTEELPIGTTIRYGKFNFTGNGDWIYENEDDGEMEIGV